MNLTNPIVLIVAGVIFLALIYFWNKRNATNQHQRRNKNFRSSYYERKKEREKENRQ